MLENSWQFLGDDHTGALEALDGAISIKLHNALAWSGRGIALVKLGILGEALDAFDEAINLDPDNALAWSGGGIALVKLGRLEPVAQTPSTDQRVYVR